METCVASAVAIPTAVVPPCDENEAMLSQWLDIEAGDTAWEDVSFSKEESSADSQEDDEATGTVWAVQSWLGWP